MKVINIVPVLVFVVFALPFATAEARYSGEIAGWLPWWSEEGAIEDAEDNIRDIDILYPFVFEVDEDGGLVEKVDLEDRDWKNLFKKARKRDVEIIPTVMWFDGDQIHEVLSDQKKRRDHIKEIVEMVDDGDFDGVNIDYEQKNAETIDYFSKFLKELEDELGRDELTCTIEARMPPESVWSVVPETIEYANDYEAMDRYCDWVELMTYDQQRADILLNKKRRGVPYAPVADIDWVEKVLKLALKDIDEDKIMLGIPTYGRAWDVTVAPEWYRDYTKVASLNHKRIIELSEKYDAPIGRTAGGEAVISYFPEDSVWKIFNQLPTPEGTPKGFEAAAKALFVATYTGREIPVRFVTWGDAHSAEDKLDLAEEYDLKGAAFFKFDGEEDSDIWDLF